MLTPSNVGLLDAGKALDPLRSRVICFTSAKGGSGKTILAASTAWILMQAKFKVVVLDTDFSTRGLSLFILEALTYSNPNVRPENCIADALLKDIPADRIRPLVVEQKRGAFSIILPNADFRRGGAPEDKLLRLGAGPSDFEPRYFDLLKALCDKLRYEFDFIVIDTRGGYDYSSKVPAVLADGYVIVIEADPISVQQVHGLKSNIDIFADTVGVNPNHAGFIINKALYYPEEGKQFSMALSSLYGGRIFGIIPADRNVISAYQERDMPFELNPGSDFSYHSLSAIDKFINSISRFEVITDKYFATLYKRIRRSWHFGRVLYRVEQWYSIIFLVLLALNLGCLGIYLWTLTPISEEFVVGTFIALISAACLMPIAHAVSVKRQSGIRKPLWWLSAAGVSTGFLLLFGPTVTGIHLFGVTVPGIHDVLATYQLVATLSATEQKLADQLNAANEQAKGANEKLSTFVGLRQQLERERDDLKAKLAKFGTPIKEPDATRQHAESLSVAVSSALRDRSPLECPFDQVSEAESPISGDCLQKQSPNCFMENAITWANRGDYSTAYHIAMAAQCGNPDAMTAIEEAGASRVGEYLRTIETSSGQRSSSVAKKGDARKIKP